jgi:hypothetical protein
MVEHHLLTTGRFRRLDPQMYKAAKVEFKKLELQVVVHHSGSCLVSPLHMVCKAMTPGGPAETSAG